MSFPDHHSAHPPDGSPDSELDRLLAWSIQDEFGSAKAPEGAWQRFLCELKANNHPRLQPVRPRRWRTASLAQGLAIASLLVIVGLSLSPALQWPAYLRGSSESPDIATRTPPVYQQPESVPFLGDDGLLSGLELRQFADEMALQRQAMAKDTSPKFDPILKYRHDWTRTGSQVESRPR